MRTKKGTFFTKKEGLYQTFLLFISYIYNDFISLFISYIIIILYIYEIYIYMHYIGRTGRCRLPTPVLVSPSSLCSKYWTNSISWHLLPPRLSVNLISDSI